MMANITKVVILSLILLSTSAGAAEKKGKIGAAETREPAETSKVVEQDGEKAETKPVTEKEKVVMMRTRETRAFGGPSKHLPRELGIP